MLLRRGFAVATGAECSCAGHRRGIAGGEPMDAFRDMSGFS